MLSLSLTTPLFDTHDVGRKSTIERNFPVRTVHFPKFITVKSHFRNIQHFLFCGLMQNIGPMHLSEALREHRCLYKVKSTELKKTIFEK